MKIDVEYTQEDIKKLILADLRDKFDGEINEHLLTIQVKSKQNYKSEWETADFKATYQKNF